MEQEYKDEFTISRKEWLRGEGGGYLLDERSNKKCCLGFYALYCGMLEKDILGITSPGRLALVKINMPDKMKWLVEENALEGSTSGFLLNDTVAGRDLITINDDETLPEWERETKIKEAFATIANTKVNFVD